MNRAFAISLLVLILTVALSASAAFFYIAAQNDEPETFWKYQCIDTMKYSRDLARDLTLNPDAKSKIDGQISIIKSAGANCVSIGTPYDEEFIPILSLWVQSARAKGLTVWFRGNLSGWEGWFGYQKLSGPEEHNKKISQLITTHPDLFKDGDIFTPAPEPENGLLGDPRRSESHKQAFLQFLVSSYKNCSKAFSSIGKDVGCGYFSTNGDIAKDILTKDVVEKIGNIIVIDHYISNPKNYGRDIRFLHEKYGAKIFLGEFGAPVLDLHGGLGEKGQADFIAKTLAQLYENKDIVAGLNYWVLEGGSTQLVNRDGTTREGINALKKYFLPAVIRGRVTNPLGDRLSGIVVKTEDGLTSTQTNWIGDYSLTLLAGKPTLVFQNDNYVERKETISASEGEKIMKDIQLEPKKYTFVYRLRLIIQKLWR